LLEATEIKAQNASKLSEKTEYILSIFRFEPTTETPKRSAGKVIIARLGANIVKNLDAPHDRRTKLIVWQNR